MPKIFSLRIMLPLSILGVILITLSVATAHILHTADSVILFAKTNRVEEVSHTLARNIATQLERVGQDLVLTASLPGVLEGLTLTPENTTGIAALSALLNRVRLTYGYYDGLYLASNNNTLIAGVTPKNMPPENTPEREWYHTVLEENTFVVGTPMPNKTTGKMLLPVALKAVYNGKVGVLVASLRLAQLAEDSIREAARSGVHVLLVHESGTVVAAQEQHSMHINLGAEPWFPEIIHGVYGSLQISWKDEPRVVGFYHIPQTHLYAVVVADEDYMGDYKATIQQATLLGFLTVGLLTLGCVIVFIFPVTRDIHKLRDFARRVTQGEDGGSTGVHRKDELGELSASLTLMVESLQDSLNKSEAATKAKSEFLARMSHEIRTPMNGIIGMTHLAMRAAEDDKQKTYLQRIDNAAKSLLGIINDILDFSKIEAGKLELEERSFSLAAVLRQVHDIIAVQSQAKGLVLRFTTAQNVPDALRGDPLRLSQVCLNLCSNAVKFTSQGSITLHVDLANNNAAEPVLQFTITDTGIGMTEEEQARIFDAFSQADGSTTRRYGGTGLGLSISRLLVEKMGGTLHVHSTPGKGSTFSFTLACKAEAAPAEVATAQASTQQHLAPLRILLAEDNEVNQIIAMEILGDMGMHTTLANNGAEALELFKTNAYDLILMDIQMPVMDGLSAAKAIRHSGLAQAARIPIIAMTANAMSGDKEISLAAGMNDHITKPLDLDELRATLQHWGHP